MPRVLFDVNVPRPASRFLTGHTVEFAGKRGWRELGNGDLLAVAEVDGFEVLATADQNLRYQQNLAGRKIAIVELSSNRWSSLRANPDLVTETTRIAGKATATGAASAASMFIIAVSITWTGRLRQ